MDWKDLVAETLDTETMLVGGAELTYSMRLTAYDRVGNACQVEKAVQVLEMLK